MNWTDDSLRALPIEIRVPQGDNHLTGDSLATNMNALSEWNKDGHVARLVRILKQYSQSLVPSIENVKLRFENSKMYIGKHLLTKISEFLHATK